MTDNPNFRISIGDLAKIQAKLEQLPPKVGAAGMAAGAGYLLNVLVNKEIPPYKYIPRSQVPWASDKQRRYVMAAIRRGDIEIPYVRSGKSTSFGTDGEVQGQGVQGDWEFNTNEQGRSYLTNRKQYAHWLYGEDQSKRHGLIGWKKITQILSEYTRNIVAAFQRGVNTYIKNHPENW